jgi:dipeptidyl aminopeptidase/acylaminoacyl peptidase
MRNTRAITTGVVMLAMLAALAGCTSAVSPTAPAAPTQPPASAPTASSLSAPLDGLMFIRDGALYRVANGAAGEILSDGHRKIALATTKGSADVLVSEAKDSGVDVVWVRGRGANLPTTLLRHIPNVSDFVGARIDSLGSRLYVALSGDPSARMIWSPLGQPSVTNTMTLGFSFSGEFDLDYWGRGIVYTSVSQNPARLLLARGATAVQLTSKTASAFTPAVSNDGESVCFTGAAKAADKIAVWVLDRRTNAVRQLAATRGLQPANPVFSADGQWIAFRAGTDGQLRVVRVDGSGLTKLSYLADDVPLAW